MSDAAALLGVSPSTLRNWDRCGKVAARRHPVNGYRLYVRQDLIRLLKQIERAAARAETVRGGR